MASVKETVETSLKTERLRLQKNAMELISKHNYGYLQRFVFEEATYLFDNTNFNQKHSVLTIVSGQWL